MGVDVECSLVVEGQQVSDGGSPARDVIVWMDHRAVAESEEINAGGYDVLDLLVDEFRQRCKRLSCYGSLVTDPVPSCKHHISWILPTG